MFVISVRFRAENYDNCAGQHPALVTDFFRSDIVDDVTTGLGDVLPIVVPVNMCTKLKYIEERCHGHTALIGSYAKHICVRNRPYKVGIIMIVLHHSVR